MNTEGRLALPGNRVSLKAIVLTTSGIGAGETTGSPPQASGWHFCWVPFLLHVHQCEDDSPWTTWATEGASWGPGAADGGREGPTRSLGAHAHPDEETGSFPDHQSLFRELQLPSTRTASFRARDQPPLVQPSPVAKETKAQGEESLAQVTGWLTDRAQWKS